jgi:2-keto-4-pentenoate hydratase/2-oxohepta-3-ene-1,7-dioic acid hydratase in catechol pathway
MQILREPSCYGTPPLPRCTGAFAPCVGVARKPPVFMQPGDVFEVEIERLGVLSNPVQDG